MAYLSIKIISRVTTIDHLKSNDSEQDNSDNSNDSSNEFRNCNNKSFKSKSLNATDRTVTSYKDNALSH